jgi:LPXTG-motif cell wall-anchored protein
MGENRAGRWRAGAGVAAMAVGSVLLVGAYGGTAGATGDDSSNTTSTSIVSGNPTCQELVGSDHEFKIEVQGELPDETTYTDAATGFEVTLSNVHVNEDGNAEFDFVANTPVSVVFVKAGPGGILYTFEEPTTDADGLMSDRDSISHISFCWNDEEGTTTTKQETTTTMRDDTTTTMRDDTTTSSVEDTTTTEHEETTTSEVEGTSTSGEVTTTTESGGGLPVTGSNTMMLVGIGVALLLGGGLLLASNRQLWRRHT